MVDSGVDYLSEGPNDHKASFVQVMHKQMPELMFTAFYDTMSVIGG